jgi:hypothetical protein
MPRLMYLEEEEELPVTNTTEEPRGLAWEQPTQVTNATCVASVGSILPP